MRDIQFEQTKTDLLAKIILEKKSRTDSKFVLRFVCAHKCYLFYFFLDIHMVYYIKSNYTNSILVLHRAYLCAWKI